MTYEKEDEELDAEEGKGQEPAGPQVECQPAPESDLEARLAKAESDAAGYFAQLQRTMADFDNYRKRVSKERDELARAAAERVMIEILEPVENLDRALEAAAGARSVKRLRDGVEMTRDQIWCVLERNGLRKVETVGAMFDPRWHEAVETTYFDGAEDGAIIGEIARGYALNGKCLRCAKVKVSKKSKAEDKE